MSKVCICIFLTLSVCLCLCLTMCACARVYTHARVCLNSDEAGGATWRLIHHFPPWPAVPSEEHCAVTVTLGSFWTRKMVHLPPTLPLHVVAPLASPSSKPTSLEAAVTIPLTISNSFPGFSFAHCINRDRLLITVSALLKGPCFFYSYLVKLLQVGSHLP